MGRGGLLPRLPRRAWLVLGGDAVSSVGTGLTVSFLLVYFHRVRGIPLGTAGAAVSCLALAGFAGNILGGSLADRIGARRATIVGLWICAVGSIAIVGVRSAWEAAAAAAVYGFGTSTVWPAQDTLLAQAVPVEQMSAVFSVRHMTMNAGFGIGGLAAAFIADLHHPHTFVLLYLIDAATFVAFIPVLAFGVRAIDRKITDVADAEDTAESAVSSSFRHVFADKRFRLVWAIAALLVFAGYAQINEAFPVYATGQGRISAGAVGLTVTANTVVVVVLALVTLRLMHGRRRTTGLIVTATIWATSWVVTMIAGQLGGGTAGVTVFVLASATFAIGETFLSPSLTPLVNDLATDANRGRYNGLATLAWTTGFFLGPLAAGVSLPHARGFPFFDGLIAVLGVVVILVLALRRRLTPDIDLVPADSGEVDGAATTPIPEQLRLAQLDRRSGDYAAAVLAARDAATALDLQAGGATRVHVLLDLARAEQDVASYESAEKHARQALDAAAGDDLLRTQALTRLADILGDLGRPTEAMHTAQEAVTAAEHCRADGPTTSDALVTLATMLLGASSYAEAEQVLARALAADAGGPAAARLLMARLVALRMTGRYDEAYALQPRAREAVAAAFGVRSLEYAVVLNEAGVCGKFAGRFDDAVDQYAEALALLTDIVGDTHPFVATIYHNLGGLAHARGDFAAAEPHARRSVSVREAAVGADHLDTAADKVALAAILQDLDQLDEADALLRDALVAYESAYGSTHYEVAVIEGNLGSVAKRRGDFAAAAEHHGRALAIKEAVLGAEHPQLAITANNLAVALRRLGRDNEAAALYRRAIAILEPTVAPDHPVLATARANLAGLSPASPP